MTTASVDLSRIQASAAAIEPMRVLVFLFALPFLVLGWVARIVWIAVALALASTREGWTVASAQVERRQKQAASG